MATPKTTFYTNKWTSLEVNYGMSGFPDEAMSVNGQPCVIHYADRLVSGFAHEGWSCVLSEF